MFYKHEHNQCIVVHKHPIIKKIINNASKSVIKRNNSNRTNFTYIYIIADH